MIKNHWIRSSIKKQILAFISAATFDPANIDDFRARFKSHFPNRNADVVVKNYWIWMTSQVKYEFVVDGVVYVV